MNQANESNFHTSIAPTPLFEMTIMTLIDNCSLFTVKSLVIGYGNSLRSDDGIGIEMATVIDRWHLPGVRSLALHQLTPELAAELALVDRAIFIDARQGIDTDPVELHRLKPSVSTEFPTHLGDPRVLLSLTQAIYGKCPQAWWAIVPGINFQVGDRLSPLAQRNIEQALIQIESLLTNPEYARSQYNAKYSRHCDRPSATKRCQENR